MADSPGVEPLAAKHRGDSVWIQQSLLDDSGGVNRHHTATEWAPRPFATRAIVLDGYLQLPGGETEALSGKAITLCVA